MAQPTKGALHAMPSYASRRGGSHNVTPPSLAFAFLAVLSILFAGAVLTEKTFSIDGMGSLLLESVDSKDMTMIQGVIVVYAAIIVLISLLVDIFGAIIDPRIRL